MNARGFLGGVLVALMVSGCGKKPEAPLPPVEPPAVRPVPPLHPVEQVETPLLPECVAELRGSQETPVMAKTAGYLVKQVYRDGDVVLAGDVLFLLDLKMSHADGKTESIKITTPVAGAPSRALHGAGDWIEATSVLTTIAAVEPIRAEFNLSGDVYRKNAALLDAVVAKPLNARPVTMELVLPDSTVYPEKGRVVEILHLGGTGAVTLRVEFPNPQHALHPGEFVKVREVR